MALEKNITAELVPFSDTAFPGRVVFKVEPGAGPLKDRISATVHMHAMIDGKVVKYTPQSMLDDTIEDFDPGEADAVFDSLVKIVNAAVAAKGYAQS